MLQYQFRPINRWPGERNRFAMSSKFDTPHSKTLDLLERELKFLAARQIVIQADCDSSQIRNDGMLYSNARMRSPGIILSFESKHGPLSYPCDKYSKWEDNLRAIALSLEALRSVDRYGVTRRAEQYKGWARLPGPVDAVEFASAADAAVFIVSLIPPPHQFEYRHLDVRELFEKAYRIAAGAVHPDRTGGDDTQFKRLQAAKAVLEKHHAREAVQS